MSQLTKSDNPSSLPTAGSVRLVLAVALLAFTVMACAPIRNSPFGEEVDASFADLNGNSQILLPTFPFHEDTDIRFSILADAYANYDDLSRVVDQIRSSDSMFAVNLGDMTEMGLALEYEAFASHVDKINKPLFSVIGNHDTIGNGKLIYQKLFGAYNYYFDLNGVRFVFFNNNALDFYSEGIDLDWLQRTVEESVNPVLIFQHVNVLNAEYFSPSQLMQIQEILNPEKVLAVFHGHHHHFKTYEVNQVLVQQVARVQGSQYSQVHVTQNTITITNCSQGGRCETVHRTYGTTYK